MLPAILAGVLAYVKLSLIFLVPLSIFLDFLEFPRNCHLWVSVSVSVCVVVSKTGSFHVLGVVHFLDCIPGWSVFQNQPGNVSYPRCEKFKMFRTPAVTFRKCFGPPFPGKTVKCFIPPIWTNETPKCFLPPI